MPLVTPKPVKAWPDSNGVLHPTIESWRIAEMLALLHTTDGSGAIDEKALETMAIDLAGNQAESLLAILTTGPRSRPAARKRAGTTNPKRATKRLATEPVTQPPQQEAA